MSAQAQALTGMAEALKQKIETRKAQVGVIGLGYVGLPLALLFSEQRFPVTGFDIDQHKVKTWSRVAPIFTASRPPRFRWLASRASRPLLIFPNWSAWTRSSSAYPPRWTNIANPTSALLPRRPKPSPRTSARAS